MLSNRNQIRGLAALGFAAAIASSALAQSQFGLSPSLSSDFLKGTQNNPLMALMPSPVGTSALQSGGTTATSAPQIEGFIANAGQWDSRAKFLSKGPNSNVWVTDKGLVIDFYSDRRDKPVTGKRGEQSTLYRTSHVVEMSFVGALSSSRALGTTLQTAKYDYISRRGRYSASNYAEANVNSLYSGVNMRVYVDKGFPRYDLVVQPGADVKKIGFKLNGANSVSVGSGNSLTIGTQLGQMQMGGLYVYQSVGRSQRQIPASFAVQNGVVRFNVGTYDRTKPLIIDPVVYSTLLGGNGNDDIITDVAVDSNGFAYATGSTAADDFPTTVGAFQEVVKGQDAFVTKLLKDGTGVVFSTRLGGSGTDTANSISILPSGNIAVAGFTGSTDFPVTGGAFQSTKGTGNDSFITVLDTTGKNLVWSTYLGGNGEDSILKIASDSSGNIYFGGNTGSTNLPVLNALQATKSTGTDMFVGRFKADGTGLLFLTYLGGNGTDQFAGLAVDTSDNVYVTGTTLSTNFPVTAGAFDTTLKTNGLHPDGTVSCLTSAGAFKYSTVLGGNDDDTPSSIAVDPSGNAIVFGTTNSFNFPRSTNPMTNTWNLGSQMFLSKLNPTGTALVFSTYLTTVAGYTPGSVATDSLGNIYLAGAATSPDAKANLIPLAGDGKAFTKGVDAFLLAVDSSGSNFFYAGYFGSDSGDAATAVAVDKNFQVFLGGITNSENTLTNQFPTTPNAFKAAQPKGNPVTIDGFMMKLRIIPPVEVGSITVSPSTVVGGVLPYPTGTVTLTKAAPDGGVRVALTSSDPAAVVPTSVTIPAGQTSSDPFSISTRGDLAAPVQAVITASYQTSSAKSVLTVSPWLNGLSVSLNRVVGGNALTGTISLAAAAPVGGITVTVASSIPELVPDTTVVVAEGQTSATFNILTTGVDATKVGTLTASFESASKTFDVTLDPASLRTVTFDPARVAGGTSATGTVTLDGTWPTNRTITLASDKTAQGVTLPSTTITMLAGHSTATFTVNTTSVTGTLTATITATNNSTTISGLLTVDKVVVSSLAFAPSSGAAGDTLTGTVTISPVANTGGTTVALSILSGNAAGLTIPATVTVPAGSTSATFTATVNSILVDSAIVVKAAIGTSNAQATVNVTGARLVSVSVNPSTLIAGIANATGTVTLQTPAPTGGVVIALSSDNTHATVPSTVTVAAGATTATFPITTTAVTADATANISATLGATTVSTALTLKTVSISDVSFSPNSTLGGLTVQLTITLDSPAPAGGVVVGLAASNNKIALPSSVSIAAGQTSVTINVPTSRVSRDLSSVATATLGSSSGSDAVTMRR